MRRALLPARRIYVRDFADHRQRVFLTLDVRQRAVARKLRFKV